MTAPPRLHSADHARVLERTALDRTQIIGLSPTLHQRATSPIANDKDIAAGAAGKFSLSATQVMASMAAAVTAALVGSRLGVAGTVIGAGLASVISVVGGAVIGHSILLTRKQVKRAVFQVRGVEKDSSATVFQRPTLAFGTVASPRNPADDYTVVIPAVTSLEPQSASRYVRPGPGHAEPGRPRPTRPPRRLSTGVLIGVAAAVAIFASSLGAVTLAETIKGSPLSGGESGGLSVLGGSGGTQLDGPVTTTTSIVTEPSTVTQTVTSETTAPATNTQSPATQSPASQSVAPTSGATPAASSPAGSAAPTSPAVPTGSAVPNSVAATAIPSVTAQP